MTDPAAHDDDLRALSAWSRFIGKALFALAVLNLILLGAMIGGLIALEGAINSQGEDRDRDHCVTSTYAPAFRDLFVALVELDRDGNVSDTSSQALVERAEELRTVPERCEPGAGTPATTTVAPTTTITEPF